MTSMAQDLEVSVPPVVLSGKRGGDVVIVSSVSAEDLSVDSAIRYSSLPPGEVVRSGDSQMAAATFGSNPTFPFTKQRNLVCILNDYHVDLDMPAMYVSAEQVIVRALDIRNQEPVTLTFMKNLEPFQTELESRVDLDTDHILQVKRAILDSTALPQSADFQAMQKLNVESMDTVMEDIHQYLSQLLTRTIHSDSVSLASPKSFDMKYPYVLCQEGYDTSLALFMSHNSVIDISIIRQIVRDIVTGLISLHSENRIHAMLNPKTIVRVGSVWKLKDLSISLILGQASEVTHFNLAHSPPEVAQGYMNTITGYKYLADTSYDLWSLGCVIFHLIKGSPLWNCNAQGNISQSDLISLAQWSPQQFLNQAQLFFSPDGQGDDERAVLDLLSRLLMPTPQDRKEFFPFGVVSVNQHEFLEATPLENDTLVALSAREAAVSKSKSDHTRYSKLTSNLTLEEQWELHRARDVLLLGLFESTSFPSPTQFVVLTEKLPPLGTLETVDVCQARLHNALEWIDLCHELSTTVVRALNEGDVSSIGRFWKIVRSKLPVRDYMYLYFVDDLTAEIARGGEGDKYPIEIKNQSDILPKIFPLMEVTMRSMALYHGVAGIARMFGCTPSRLTDSVRIMVQPKVDELKNERFASDFGLLADDVKELRLNKEKYLKGNSIRSQSIHSFVTFLQRKVGRQVNDFGGLKRMSDEKGVALWTACNTEELVREAISLRKEERLKEEQNIWSMSQDVTIAALKKALDEEMITKRLLKEDYDVLFDDNVKSRSENKELQATVADLTSRLAASEEMLFKYMRKKKGWSKIFKHSSPKGGESNKGAFQPESMSHTKST